MDLNGKKKEKDYKNTEKAVTYICFRMRGGEVPKRNNQYSNFNTQQPNKNDDNSSFKYPKEHMLSLYEPVDSVTSSIQHDYLVNNEGNSSLSFLEKEVK